MNAKSFLQPLFVISLACADVIFLYWHCHCTEASVNKCSVTTTYMCLEFPRHRIALCLGFICICYILRFLKTAILILRISSLITISPFFNNLTYCQHSEYKSSHDAQIISNYIPNIMSQLVFVTEMCVFCEYDLNFHILFS